MECEHRHYFDMAVLSETFKSGVELRHLIGGKAIIWQSNRGCSRPRAAVDCVAPILQLQPAFPTFAAPPESRVWLG